MRGILFSALAFVFSLAVVAPMDHSFDDSVTSVVNTKEPEMVLPQPRHFVFRPLIVTRERNRDLQRYKKEHQQRRRYKQKHSSQRRPSTNRQAKNVWSSDQPTPHSEIVKMISPQDTVTRTFNLYSMENEGIPMRGAEHPGSSPSATLLLSRPRRSTDANSSSKDIDDIRPSTSMILTKSNTAEKSSNTTERLSDEESMETAENVLFRPLFVHRLRKIEKHRRRQLQMRPQKRPKKPQRQQSRPQQRPSTRPQPIRPQRPVQSTSQKKRPQSTRRGQFYYVAAAGPLGQWVYYPYYYPY